MRGTETCENAHRREALFWRVRCRKRQPERIWQCFRACAQCSHSRRLFHLQRPHDLLAHSNVGGFLTKIVVLQKGRERDQSETALARVLGHLWFDVEEPSTRRADE